jgi:hypothetical protein
MIIKSCIDTFCGIVLKSFETLTDHDFKAWFDQWGYLGSQYESIWTRLTLWQERVRSLA